MKQYQDLLQNILDNGVEKESGRANMPNTIGISFGNIQHDLKNGFPLLTTKKMYWKGIVHELLWFLRGETNIKYLVDNNVNIWNADAYRWYLKKMNDIDQVPYFKTMDSFINAIKNSVDGYLGEYDHYKLGDLGKVYGYQWRNQNGVDQIAEVIKGLQTNPYSRYHIIDGWNKADFSEMALPPCHLLYQFICRKPRKKVKTKWYQNILKFFKLYKDKYIIDDDSPFILDLNMYQRSVDTALGNPFNVASMALLNILIAKTCNMIPGKINWIGGDTHLYVNHIESVKEQLKRKPLKLPELKINKNLNSLEDILYLNINDFELIGYESHPKIDFELFTGLKK